MYDLCSMFLTQVTCSIGHITAFQLLQKQTLSVHHKEKYSDVGAKNENSNHSLVYMIGNNERELA